MSKQDKLLQILRTIGEIEDVTILFVQAQQGIKLAQQIKNYSLLVRVAKIAYQKFYVYQKYDEFVTICDQLLQEALMQNDATQIAYALHNLGIGYKELGLSEKAINYLKKAIEVNKARGEKESLGRNYNVIGNAYEKLGDAAQALDYFEKGVAICKQTTNRMLLVQLLGNMGTLYVNIRHCSKAQSMYQEALEIAEKIPLLDRLPKLFNGMGMCYYHLNEFETAISYYQKAIQHATKHNQMISLGYSYNDMGVLHKNLGQYEKAITYYLKALKIRKEGKNMGSLASTIANMANIYSIIGKHDQALIHLHEAKKIMAHDDTWVLNIPFMEICSDIFYRKGDFKKASDYLKKVLELMEEKNRKTFVLYRSVSEKSVRSYKLPKGQKNDKEKIIRDTEHIELVFSDKRVIIPINTILWVKAANSFIEIQTEQGLFEFQHTLTKLCDSILLSTPIKRVHKSWAVNKEKVYKEKNNVLYIICGSEAQKIPYGRSYKK